MNGHNLFRPILGSIFSTASRVAYYRQLPHQLYVSRVVAPAIFARFYSATVGLSKTDVEDRILQILKRFDKIDDSKVSLDGHFSKDFGLDSLDTVEVVMAIEEEFAVEIPDKEADEIISGKQAVEYILKREDAS